MTSLLIAAGTAFTIAVLGTPLLIRLLRARGIGQLIRDDGPFRHPHAAKAGTPTMGGIALVGAALIGYSAAHVRTEQLKFARTGVTLLTLVTLLAVVGFVDDLLGVRRRRNLGLRKRGKTAGQLLAASGFALLALNWVQVSTHLSFIRDLDLNLGSTLWFVVAVVVVVGAANGVNLTDGMDGLAAGSATLAFAAFTIIAFWQFRHAAVYHVRPAAVVDLAVVAAAMMGASGGFLYWNAAPARIFMGDTGSMAIGGALAGLALLTKTLLLLPILGGLYVVETLSVIAQVISFRGFGRRVLRMAPIHHHFEVIGWPEFTVIVRFWLFAGVCVALALGLFYADFINIPGAIG
ncbi:MAG TPA: phospho-N-acetylmuramoyl-pentapeptide-transferase [Acidimicrobiia bacterium]|nr:phospho-N-acetylmuramoyl-pentapeptide-transferase [Acidimicrobiia bacterium]HEV3450725.1 phospho-N-acetylmuramoyl-pentapeptide-transferase [Acidimicrobiia bacterium]